MELIEKIKRNKITKKLLDARNLIDDEQIEKFFNPALEDLCDPFLYKGVSACVERIKEAINKQQRVLICGDYDTDGISASYILFDFLKSQGLVCDVHIPSRVSEGYGINLNYVLSLKQKPDLIITVDCGIACAKEIEQISAQNIDVVVTDHHNYPEQIPNCVIFDPKCEDTLFDGFCGAGVVLKLVQAMGGLECVKKYLDIATIATIGDIVPIVDENRIIVSFGLEKLNKNPNKNLKILLDFLNMSNVSSMDIPFKLVPFLNSSGRVDCAEKVFYMLCSENDTETHKLIDDINKDNEQRLKNKEIGLQEIDRLMEDVDLNFAPCLFFRSTVFDEGIIGILASMLSGKYERPVIVFNEKDGMLKGSGRSYGNFNLHEVVTSFDYLCEKIGGHDYACGLSIKAENYDEFMHGVCEKIGNVTFDKTPAFEMEIDVEDITPELFNLVSKFEPFGLNNPKPKFAILAQNMSYDYLSTKSHKHFLLNVDGTKIVAFFAQKYLQTFDSNEIKQLVVEFNENVFNGKINNQIVLRTVITKDVFKMVDDENEVLMKEFLFAYKNMDLDNYDVVEIDLDGLAEIVASTEKFGTVFVCRRQSELVQMKAILKAVDVCLPIQFLPYENGASMVCTTFDIALEQFKDYKRVVFLSKPVVSVNMKAKENQEIFVFADDEQVWENNAKLSLDRKLFGFTYTVLDKIIKQNMSFESLEDVVLYIEKTQNVVSKSEICFNLCVFLENKLIKINFLENGKLQLVRGEKEKNELENSNIYREISEKL